MIRVNPVLCGGRNKLSKGGRFLNNCSLLSNSCRLERISSKIGVKYPLGNGLRIGRNFK